MAHKNIPSNHYKQPVSLDLTHFSAGSGAEPRRCTRKPDSKNRTQKIRSRSDHVSIQSILCDTQAGR